MSADVKTLETREILAKGSQESAVFFMESVERIDWQSNITREEFCELCLALAGAGWKSYESLNLYLSIATQLPDDSVLLGVGRMCLQFSGYSFEPTNRYLELVAGIIEHERYVYLPEIEEVACLYQDRYHHASGMLADYFLAAAVQLSEHENSLFRAWLIAAEHLVSAHRDHIVAFFDFSRSGQKIDWSFFCRLLNKSRNVAKAYLEHAKRIRSLSERLIDPVHDLIEHHATGDILELIRSLSTLGELNEEEALSLLRLSGKCPDAESAILLIDLALELPLKRPEIIDEWLHAGLTEAGENAVVRSAWIGLESSKSRATMEALQGIVRFDQHQRVFDLMAEATVGRRMRVCTADEDEGLRPDVVACNGKDIFLPESVNLFESRAANFDFYRVSLFHQLGLIEFGCFDQIGAIQSRLAEFNDVVMAQVLFTMVENARVDWFLVRLYPGIQAAMSVQKKKAWTDRDRARGTSIQQILEVLLGIGLDADYESAIDSYLIPLATMLWSSFQKLRPPDADVAKSLEVTVECYKLVEDFLQATSIADTQNLSALLTLEELPEPVAFRGEMDMAQIETTLKIEALINELEESIGDAKETLSVGAGDPDQVDLADLIEGEVGEGASLTIEELAHQIDVDKERLESAMSSELAEFLGGVATGKKEADIHRYDEWDYSINDYRSRWCALHEYRGLDEDEDYFYRTLDDYQVLAQSIRQQLNRVRPEMLKKVRGFPEGEELDLERSVEFFVDKRARLTPDENIYIQRQRKQRDVSTLFLLDMSASTDDIIVDPDKEPVIDSESEDEEQMMEYFRLRKAYEDSARRIIDLEKQSVILMSEALEELGDAYSVCGFSGYGRDQVDYYLCKGFDDVLDDLARRRIGGIKPCRSTRMGAPIRHATRQLQETGSRIKALIMISDGYPQDHDYGADRNSKEYGLMDTMKALAEARQQGVLTYCLTVDPSGHDYLREMCPEGQYMVIQDIEQLPEELSRVYRSLTG